MHWLWDYVLTEVYKKEFNVVTRVRHLTMYTTLNRAYAWDQIFGAGIPVYFKGRNSNGPYYELSDYIQCSIYIAFWQ